MGCCINIRVTRGTKLSSTNLYRVIHVYMYALSGMDYYKVNRLAMDFLL